MASCNLIAALSLLLVLPLVSAGVKPGVIFGTLSKTLVVNASINGQPISVDGTSEMKYGLDNLTITWALNSSFAGKDADYKQVFFKLCFGAKSAIDRPWRKNNVDLRKSKTCKYSIKRFTYNASGGSLVYRAVDTIPDASYFVRAFVLNTTDREAGPADHAVAFGQTTDVNRTKSLFHVIGFSGRNKGITIFTICFSVVSYATLIGYFLVERSRKKNV